MTAIAAPRPRRLFGLLPPKPEPILVNGHLIKYRTQKQLLWTVISIIFIPAIIAGAYYAIFEMHYFGYSAKLWWDNGMAHWFVPGFISAQSWPLYRHGWRDLFEPAAATIGGKSLLARGWKHGKDKRLHPVGLLFRVLAVFVVATVLIFGGVWALNFGIPQTGFNPQAGLLGKLSAGQIVLGFLVGLVVHVIWAPAGNTLQGFFTDRAALKIRAKRAAGNIWYVPFWVRYELLPPVVLERTWWTLAQPKSIRVSGRLEKVVIIPVLILLFLLGILGLMARYGFAHGWHVPVLNP